LWNITAYIGDYCKWSHTINANGEINDGNKTLLFASDLIPTNNYLRYSYIPAFDNRPLITLEEKKQFFPKIYEEGWIIALEHDIKYQACTIKPDAKGKGFIVDKEVIITE